MRINFIPCLSFVCFICLVGIESKKVDSTTRPSKTSDALLNFEKNLKVPCDSHTNCSSRILTLDTYCCPSTNHCCNWFKFAATYKPESTMPLKAPSILTILAIMLLIICFLFVSYCFSILFCFCFKCGIFKRPKIIIHSQMNNSDSGLFTSGNASPKHSTSTTSSASSSSSYTNRRHHRQSSSSKNYRNQKKTHNKHRHRRSPTARASNKRPQYDTEIYMDFDANQNTESPFLIPPELNDQVQQRLNRSNNENNHDSSYRCNNNNSNPASSGVTPSAPLALDEHETADTNNLVNHRNLLEPLRASSLSVSTNSSLDFGASQTVVNNNDHRSNPQTSSSIVTNTNMFHYPDEQPPSYDEIIRRNY